MRLRRRSKGPSQPPFPVVAVQGHDPAIAAAIRAALEGVTTQVERRGGTNVRVVVAFDAEGIPAAAGVGNSGFASQVDFMESIEKHAATVRSSVTRALSSFAGRN